MEKKYDLRPVWDAMLDIYEDFRVACAKLGIEFFAAYGTLLGAVRHGGFIPWDDDMDFLLRLDQFDLFLKSASEMFPSYIKIVRWGRDSGFPFLYAKLQDTRVKKLELARKMSRLPLSEGLFIDLFPYSGVPAKSFSRVARSAALRLCRCAVCAKEKKTLRSKLGWTLGQFVRPIFRDFHSAWDISEYQWRNLHRISCHHANHLGIYDCNLCRHEYCGDPLWYREAIWIKFDRTEVPAPIDYDKMLKSHYGDYMKLPPVGERIITHVGAPVATWEIH